jgi:CRP/FNR family cyclic AMP-dependent transcriptional regulator
MEFQNLKKHIEPYVSLDDREFESILSFFSVKELSKGWVLVNPGEKVHYTYWVNKGLLVSSFLDDDAKEHIIQFAIEGCWITDQPAFYNQSIASFKIVTLEDSQLLCLSYNKREELCENVPKMERFFRKKANDSFIKQQKRLVTYLTSDAEERYNLLMKEHPTLYNRVTKKILAAYLGVSRETLSRFHPHNHTK